MAKSFVHFTCCLVVVFTIIDEGNGKWKKKYTENLKKDIEKFKEMAEKIEDEIEDFYYEYSDNWPKHEYLTDGEGKSSESTDYSLHSNYGNKLNLSHTVTGNITNNSTTNEIPPTFGNTFPIDRAPKFGVIKEITSTENANIASSKWPKFEDILQDMGKKYDWKNDRWIKVKKKANQSSEENHLMSHERHKFSYKTVKLIRSKSRRNVVIAVTAVR